MAKKKRKGLALLAGAAVAGVAGVASVALAASGGGGGGGGTKTKPKSVPPPDEPDPINKPFRDIPGGGKVWRDPKNGGNGTGPSSFDFGGNKLWISVECDEVWEGNLFWNEEQQAPFPTVKETLDYNGDSTVNPNSIAGYVAYKIDEEGITDPNDIAWSVIEEVSPMCAAVEPNTMWGPGLRNWYNNFLERLIPFVEEYSTGIGFDNEA